MWGAWHQHTQHPVGSWVLTNGPRAAPLQVDVKVANKTIVRLQGQLDAKEQELGALNIKVTGQQCIMKPKGHATSPCTCILACCPPYESHGSTQWCALGHTPAGQKHTPPAATHWWLSPRRSGYSHHTGADRFLRLYSPSLPGLTVAPAGGVVP